MKNIIMTLFLIISLTACFKEELPSLNGKNFTLENNKDVTLGFADNENKMYGKYINNYFGTYKINNEDSTIKFEPIGSTMMMGPIDEMEKERVYLENLNKVNKIGFKNNILTLNGDDTELKFVEIQ